MIVFVLFSVGTKSFAYLLSYKPFAHRLITFNYSISRALTIASSTNPAGWLL